MKKSNYKFTMDSPAYLTGMVDKLLREGLSKTIKKNGLNLSGEQIHLLLFIFENDGISQKKLAEATKKSKISSVKAINLLESNNLVIRIQDTDDLRNNKIYLTPKGKKIKDPLLELVEQHTNSAFHGLSTDEIETYKAMLIKIYQNIST